MAIYRKGNKGLLVVDIFQRVATRNSPRTYFRGGNINIERHLNFKEYLMNHPDEAKKYGELKLHLAKQSPDNVSVYQAGKEAFCTEIVKKAMKWASERRNNKEENRG